MHMLTSNIDIVRALETGLTLVFYAMSSHQNKIVVEYCKRN